jgi:hypothetical protein
MSRGRRQAAALLATVAAAGCGGDGATPGTPYDVVVEVLAADCAPGRQPPLSVDNATAHLVRSGRRVTWTQAADEGPGRDWSLTGTTAVCAGRAAFTLRGDKEVGVIVGDATCHVTLAIAGPPAASPTAADAGALEGAPALAGADDAGPSEATPTCGAVDALNLVSDACGVLRGQAWVDWTAESDDDAGAACRSIGQCRLRLRWTATPKAGIDPAKACDGGP